MLKSDAAEKQCRSSVMCNSAVLQMLQASPDANPPCMHYTPPPRVTYLCESVIKAKGVANGVHLVKQLQMREGRGQ